MPVLAALLVCCANAGALLAGDVDKSGDLAAEDLDEVAAVLLGGTSQYATDIDLDGLTDAVDYQLLVRLLLGDDLDRDDDGLLDVMEEHLGTNPDLADSDEDGLSDGAEYEGETSPLDPDGDDDGLNDGEEAAHNTDPNDADSDDDGLSDGDEVHVYQSDPLDRDSDDDGLDDAREVLDTVTDPNDADTDDDGLSDGDEVDVHHTSPLLGDTDGDGLGDQDEILTHNTNPNLWDTDGDGYSDGEEIADGTDPNTAEANLIINEFLAGNNSGLKDEDGNYSDWIEIYNPRPVAADMSGWALTDSPDELQLWTFPTVSIPSGGYLVVFASGLDRRPTNGANLHTNFGLSVDGEYLALVRPGGGVQQAFAPAFPVQASDISYGFYSGAPYYFTMPTPGAANTLGVLGITEKPKFSFPSGVYDAALSLELTSNTVGAAIRYTLDGSLPTPAHGQLYEAGVPISITGTTVIRAVAYRADYVDSPVVAATYVYLKDVVAQPVVPPGFPAKWGGAGSSNNEIDGDYEMDPVVLNDPAYSDELQDALLSLPIVSLNMPVASWFSTNSGIVSNTWNNDAPGWTRAVSAEMFWPDGREIFNVNCGVRVVGGQSTNSSWKSQKHSFRLKFQEEYGPTRLDVKEPILPGTPHTSFNTLTLDARFNHSWQHWDETQRTRAQHLRDILMNDFQIALDELSPHGRYAHLFLNGLYWGMYWVHERPDESFLSDYLGGQKEDYDVIKHAANDVMAGTNQRYNTMFSMARSGASDPAVYEELATHYIQIGPFVNYMVLNFWAGNDDWDHHNWYVGANRVEETGFRYYSWDAEHTFKDLGANSTGKNNSSAPSELHQLLLQNPEYRIAFGDRAHKLLKNGGLFTNEGASPYFDKRAAEIFEGLILESARWGDNRQDRGNTSKLYTRDVHWAAEQDRLRFDYLPQRADVVLGQLRSRGAYPAVAAPSYNIDGAYQHGGTISDGAVLTMDNPNGAGTIYYTLDGTDPRVPAAAGETRPLLLESAAKRVLVPASDIGSDWRTQAGFDDSAWTSGTGGVGFEQASGFESFIGIDVGAAMYNINATCYIRIPFTLTADDLASLESLTLQVRYDDGFVAYLNGGETPIAQDLDPPALAWNASATGTHSESEASQLLSFNITPALGALHEGENFLAVHALNSSATSSDFLFSVAMEGSTTPANPEVNPAAFEYGVTPPAPLTDTVRVLARTFDGGKWSALNDAVYQIDSSDYAALRVTELMFHPADAVPAGYYNDEDYEYIEIKNTGAVTLDLGGVHFDRGIDFTFNDSRIREPQLVGPGEYFVLAKNPNAFHERHGDSLVVAGPYQGSLDNGGETLRLADPADATIVEFAYDAGWFQVTDGTGFSLNARNEALDAALWDTKDAWRPGSILGGTPGAADIAEAPEPGALVINEVLAHSHATAPDWIELHNTTSGDIDISGWFLSDSKSELMKFAFPAGSVIEANGYLVVYEDLHFGAGNPRTPFALSENGETLYLSSGMNDTLTGYSEEESFGASETGVSYGRYHKSSTDTYNFVFMSAMTPGAANAAPLVGPIVITEIMYHPADPPAGNPAAEYIELYNMSGAPVMLQDPATNLTWKMTGGVEFEFPADTVIPAGGRVLLVQDATVFNTAYPGVTAPVFVWTSGQLDNDGEQLELSKPGDVDTGGTRQYIRVDRVNYNDAAPWPLSPDGQGDALLKTDLDAYGNDVAVWSAGAPTPGE